MPKVSGRVRAFKVEDRKFIVTLELNEKTPKIGEKVTVKWGSTRTLSQNALYWVYLNWIINEGNLKEQGHFSADALHLDLKTYFLAEKIMDKGQFKAVEEPTTTTLGKAEFGEYIDKIDHFVQEFFGVKTDEFWADKENML